MNRRYGLVLDVDGVIADTEAANAAASIRVFEDMFGVEGVRRSDFEAGLGRGAEEYMRAAARVHGLDLDAGQMAAAVDARQRTFLAMLEEQPLSAFPGVLELIDAALAAADFGLAIATSGTRAKSEAVLKSARVPYQQMVYISGSDVRNKKPAPDLFQAAVARLEIPAARCVVVEDAPDGVEAARAAGCRCIAVTNSTTAERLKGADRIVSSVEEVTLGSMRELIEGKDGHGSSCDIAVGCCR